MRHKEGFTLIELLVGMLVTMLIMGALVSLFSSAVQSEMSGFKQQEVYAQARATMNDLKTTLRYADSAAVFYQGTNPITAPKENTEAVKNIDSVEYTATIYNSSTAKNESVKMTIEWAPNSNKKLLQLSKSIDGLEPLIVNFPKDISNSVFKGDGSDFPITLNKDDDSLYHIKLPYKYKFVLSGDKTDTLITDVLKGASSSASGAPPILLASYANFHISNGGNLTTQNGAVIALNAQNLNGDTNNSSFTALIDSSNVSKFAAKYPNVTTITKYNDNGTERALADAISTYSRINLYNLTVPNGSGKFENVLTFNKDASLAYNQVDINDAGQVITVNGNNFLFADNGIDIGESASCNVALGSGESGILVIYSKNNINLTNLTIPKEISALIIGSNINITNCILENCIIFGNQSNLTITDATINGMVEYRGNSQLQINGNCSFGTFKGEPTAIDAFDKYFS